MTVTLRPYQVAAAEAAWSVLRRGKNPLVVMATGTGKSPTFAALARRWVDSSTSNVIVLAHRQELLDQAHGHLERAGVPLDRVRVESVQSYYSAKRRTPTNIGLVIYDECHHAPSPCNLKVIARFRGALVVGFTATPDRGDGVGLGRVFHSLAFRYDATAATRDGYLAPVARAEASTVHDLVQLVGNRRTIVFCDTVVASKAMTARLAGAAHLDGTTPRAERVRVLADFAAGRLQFLCNCDLVTEGFDVPAVEVVAVMRNIKSRGLLAQMIGRAMRPAPGKRECLVVQLPDSVELGLVPPSEVLADARAARATRARTGARAARSGERRPLQGSTPMARAFDGVVRFWKWMWR